MIPTDAQVLLVVAHFIIKLNTCVDNRGMLGTKSNWHQPKKVPPKLSAQFESRVLQLRRITLMPVKKNTTYLTYLWKPSSRKLLGS